MSAAAVDRRAVLRLGTGLLAASHGCAAWSSPSTDVRDGVAQVPGATLWFRDAGGVGEPVVLLHPVTGSGHVWEYQIPVLRAAGYRPIAYSRRGHRGSSAIDPAAPGTAAADLVALLDVLGLARVHLVGSAAGGFVVPDVAMSFPDRLLSATIASSFGGFTDPDYRAVVARLTPPGFAALPASFRELGPSYRAAHPEGVSRWEAFEREARHGPEARQPPLARLDWPAVERITVPTMMMTGEADPYMPPPLMAMAARHLRRCETHVVPEAGHSAYWERPAAFNAALLAFLDRRRASAR